MRVFYRKSAADAMHGSLNGRILYYNERMTTENRSLMQLYPRRIDIPGLCLTALAMLSVSLSMPVIVLKKMMVWTDTYSIPSSIKLLIEQKDYALAGIIFLFSIVFPYVKLLGLLYLWFVPVKQVSRQATLDWLGLKGKWSMLDVFVVAITVVVVKLGAFSVARPREGIYIFAMSIFMSIIVTVMVENLMKMHQSSGPSKYSI